MPKMPKNSVFLKKRPKKGQKTSILAEKRWENRPKMTIFTKSIKKGMKQAKNQGFHGI